MSDTTPGLMADSPSANWRELGLLFLLAAIWGASFMLIKVGVESIPPLTLTASRLVIAAILLVAYAAPAGHSAWTDARAWGIYLFIGLFGNALPFTLISWGEVYIDSGLAAILMGIMPIATAVLAHFLTADERLSLRRASGVIIGFTGLTVLVGWHALSQIGTAVVAQITVVGGAMCYAITTIFTRRNAFLPGRVLAAGATVAGALMILPMALIYERPWELSPADNSIAAAVLLGLVPTGLAALIYFRLIKTVGATILSQVNYLIPIFGVGWGMLLLGERVTLHAIVALVFVLVGVALVNQRRAPRPLRSNPGVSRSGRG